MCNVENKYIAKHDIYMQQTKIDIHLLIIIIQHYDNKNGEYFKK